MVINLEMDQIKDDSDNLSLDADNESVIDNSEDYESEVDSNNESVDNKVKENTGWADAMAKILKTNKPKRKKTIVLAKAKKLKTVSHDKVEEEEEESVPFEVVGDGNTKQVVKTDPDKLEKTLELLKNRKSEGEAIERKFLIAKGRVKPSVLDKDREKVLQKAATKGVIQLFNAVRQQQKGVQKEIEKVGPSNRMQEKVLKSVDKRAFLDVLMGAKSQEVPQVKEEENEWAVLRSDFMMGTKLKDWDKQEDDNED